MNTTSPTNDRPVSALFVRRMTSAAAVICLCFLGFFVFLCAPFVTLLVMGLGCIGFAGLYLRASQSWAPILMLCLSWVLIAFLDEGFAASSGSWIFLIPVTLAGWILFARSPLRWIVLAMPLLIVAVSNSHDGSILRVPSPPIAPWLHLALHFVGAFLASIFCIEHLLEMERLARVELEKARAKAEMASRAKDDFLSHMSHEFRTPLNAINGFTELLIEHISSTPPPPLANEDGSECSDHLAAIRSATEHLVHIVEDILDLSRLESGEIRLNVQSFGPSAILADVRTALLQKAAQKNQSLRIESELEIPRLMGDRVRWKQILLNLVGNAIKFSPAGEIRVTTRWTMESDVAGRLELRVIDQGPGIAPDIAARIFERFVRAESVERAGTNGTGLGLAISRSLARAMGGDVALESSSSTGSVFLCSIPFLTADHSDPGSGVYTRIAKLTLKGRRVLLCEDNRLNIRLATKLLDRLEATYEVAEDGGRAMELLAANPYDLVLLDLHMPVADGFEVARYIRGSACPEHNRTIPILALTADAFEETRHKSRAAGMDDFLAKPYSFDDLATKSMQLLDRHARSC